MIELILAIVVVAIVGVSVPFILKHANTMNTKSVVQESVLNAKTYMALILKSPFTCDYIEDKDNEGQLFPMFYDGNSDFYAKNGLNGFNRRNFQPREGRNLSKKCSNNSKYTLKSIDDFAAVDADKLEVNNPTRDFIVGSKYKVEVELLKNDPFRVAGGVAHNNDVKRVTINTTAHDGDSKNEITIGLTGFASNIGDSPILEIRDFEGQK